jgi:hypothetical protein
MKLSSSLSPSIPLYLQEWMMTAKQGGEKAYKLAHRKTTIAEDQ